MEPAELWGSRHYYPTNFLIDKSGVIIARDLNIKQLRNKLAELVGK
jgi:hypothetical protein